MNKVSVVLATFNEEKNLTDCLESVKDIASEIIIVDGESTDRTVEIAKTFGAHVFVTKNEAIFHINKQKALDKATGHWILQLDADERLSKNLAKEIQHIVTLTDEEIAEYQENIPQKELFARHFALLEKRDGHIGTKDSEYAAFFIPRLNFFLGRYLRYGGVYPDGVIRLVKKHKAHFPQKDVHEQIVVNGRVGWLKNDLYHMADPTFGRYLMRWGRYTSLIARDIKGNLIVNFFLYFFLKPLSWFFMTFIRHKGFLDGWPGFVFSLFSSLRFPMAYVKSFGNK